MRSFSSWLAGSLSALLLAPLAPLYSAEYFVSLDGSDENQGTARDRAFGTIRKGLDTLQAGDTLTILPDDSGRSRASGDSSWTLKFRLFSPTIQPAGSIRWRSEKSSMPLLHCETSNQSNHRLRNPANQ